MANRQNKRSIVGAVFLFITLVIYPLSIGPGGMALRFGGNNEAVRSVETMVLWPLYKVMRGVGRKFLTH